MVIRHSRTVAVIANHPVSMGPLTNKETAMTTFSTFLNSSIYAGLGIVIFVVSFILVDKLTPGELWGEIIREKNTAVAILAGAVAIGLSIIIAAAIHG
jgi:putative membrane protein